MNENVKVIGDTLHVVLPDSQHSISFDSNGLKSEAQQAISSGQVRSIKYALAENARWNSQTLATIKGISELADDRNITSDLSAMPLGVSKILGLTKNTVIDDAEGSEEEPDDLFLTLGNMALVILAFMGAAQLKLFGAEIFVADLVALGHTREIAPMMTAIILAGRTGAAYAAQLGTMQVNEEIDALKTFGFLMLDLGAIEYVTQTQNAIGLTDVMLGVFKGSVFGVLVAITGCKEGIMSGRSASAVGDAATKAVVSGIVAIIVATAIFAVLASALGI